MDKRRKDLKSQYYKIRYHAVRLRVIHLIEECSLPVPIIRAALPTDPCDVTSAEQIRINVKATKGYDPDYHARHVFGHFLADLHAERPDLSDEVADAIALLTLEAGR